MHCFVTGASGLVGGGVVEVLRARGHEVSALVRDPAKAVRLEPSGARLVVGSLDGDAWAAEARRADAIVHCAQVDYYDRRITVRRERAAGARDAAWIRALLGAGAGRARSFVYASGAWVYGDRGALPTDEDAPLRPYRAGAFKVESERLVESEARRLGYASAVSLRLGQVYGTTGVFRRMVLDPMLSGRRARFVGDGRQLTSLLSSEDAGLAAALAAERQPGFVALNVGGDAVPVREYLAFLAARAGAPAPGGVPPWVVRLLGGLIADALSGGVSLDCARARDLLGWAATPWREGLAAALEAARAVRAA